MRGWSGAFLVAFRCWHSTRFLSSLDDVACADEYGDPGSYMDAYNRTLDKSLSGSDVAHRLVLTGLVQTPGWKNRGRVVRGVTTFKSKGAADHCKLFPPASGERLDRRDFQRGGTGEDAGEHEPGRHASAGDRRA